MSLYGLLQWLQSLPLPTAIRESATAFPWIECIHVISATFVFGLLIVLDLRLIGIFSKDQPISRMSDRIVPWIWGGFVVSAITGSLMFSQTATKYYLNELFRAKMLLLVIAALNMMIFHYFTYRTVTVWDNTIPPPAAVRMAGLASLACWAAVVIVGRWIGFTLE